MKSFNQRVLGDAARQGFLTSLLGRRRYFPGMTSPNQGVRCQAQRSAFNFLLQGFAADIAKLGLLAAQARLQWEGVAASLVLMIHNELVWEVRPAELEKAAATVQEALQDTQKFPLLKGIKFQVSLPVKVTAGENLGSLGAISAKLTT